MDGVLAAARMQRHRESDIARSVSHLPDVDVNSLVGHPPTPGFEVIIGIVLIWKRERICWPVAQPGGAGPCHNLWNTMPSKPGGTTHENAIARSESNNDVLDLACGLVFQSGKEKAVTTKADTN
ncbi:MAG: hypothetical protein Q9216_000824 [Gyalolechia sp. 2 TL-2023]